MRVIAGTSRGRRLASFKGRDVRPTPDRVREALFNLVGPAVKGKLALDLFAGTGALGIEALSRGAQSAVFIDCDNQSISVLQQNLANLPLESPTQVIHWDLSRKRDLAFIPHQRLEKREVEARGR